MIDLFCQTNIFLKIPCGRLCGNRVDYAPGRSYLSFKGIPYAEKPERFKTAVPHNGWEGVLDARRHRDVSVQEFVFSFPFSSVKSVDGSEDCLFINVYTPSLVGSRAVMFFIHPGMYNMMSGNSTFYGPEYLVTEDVVVITFNYRLGLLGFFSTGDKCAPGNYGLKDVVTALKWVQKNIKHFGGDPDRVMIFGVSSAAAMVHHLLLAPMAKGLFSRAAIQSGSVLCPWAFENEPTIKAIEAAQRLNLRVTTSEAIVNKIRHIKDLKRIIKAQDNLFKLPPPRALQPLQFVPVVEPDDSPEERFITEQPIISMIKAHYNDVPLIIGGTSDESVFGIRELMIDKDTFNRYNQNPELLIPLEWKSFLKSSQYKEVIDLIRHFYFTDGILKDTITGQYEYSKYCSDLQFLYPLDKTVRLMSTNYKSPIYYYNFSYSGALNNNKRLMFLEQFPGAIHGDEISYLFKPTFNLTINLSPTDPAFKVQRQFIRMWTNFAKTGNPTPDFDLIIDTKWEPYDKREAYLDIGNELQMKTHLFRDRMKFWRELEVKFGNKII